MFYKMNQIHNRIPSEMLSFDLSGVKVNECRKDWVRVTLQEKAVLHNKFDKGHNLGQR
jgi:hypothetical protein